MMGRGKPPNALRAKGVEKEEEEEDYMKLALIKCPVCRHI
jgi:hypothetical protein